MMRRWLQTLIQPSQWWRKDASRRGRRGRASLGLEQLEERAVMTGVAVEPAYLPEPKLDPVVCAPVDAQAPVVDPAPGRDARADVPRDPDALEKILDDIQQPPPLPTAESFGTFVNDNEPVSFSPPPEPGPLAPTPRAEKAPVEGFTLPPGPGNDKPAPLSAAVVPPANVPAAPPPVAGDLNAIGQAFTNHPDLTPRPAQPTEPPLAPGASPFTNALPDAGTPATKSTPAEGSAAPATSAEPSDGTLLQRFVVHRDEAAFTSLVQRHERFVLSVCQRVLGTSDAAQDALQATFLVLARKAGALDRDGPLTGWLYRVAYNLALRLRTAAARQQRVERSAADGRPPEIVDGSPTAALEKEETIQALHEELERLPDEYRLPLVLCYFDGRTHAEAARASGVPRGSMAKRIGEGLERLRERMLDRGFLLY